ncbi:MAG: LLM class flavin-dependent oxidoreductase [Caldilineae bacterium]|nr:MAG: LLM class flavin-dependent oxidoreductase [Caldilineae bacterium]
MPTGVDFGWILPHGRARMPSGGLAALAAQAQTVLDAARGHVRSLWIADHFMAGDDGTAPLPEALTTLAYLAAKIPDVRLGTLVLGQNYRNPALLAKMAATLQVLSGGRFVCGIGAGWKEEEYRAYGYEFPSAAVRIAQMVEAVQICRLMWDPGRRQATFHGRYYRIDRATCEPKPVPAPPVLIGGGGEKLTLRAVAEYADWWNLPGVSPDEFARKTAILARHCGTVGRDPAVILKSWKGVVAIARTREEAAAHLHGYPIWPGDVPLLGTPEDIREQIGAYVRAGVQSFMLEFADEPATEGVRLFAEEVAPAFRAESRA